MPLGDSVELTLGAEATDLLGPAHEQRRDHTLKALLQARTRGRFTTHRRRGLPCPLRYPAGAWGQLRILLCVKFLQCSPLRALR
jgi:hypothetical protein